MDYFRVTQIKVEDDEYKTDTIQLVNPLFDKDKNHFTLIVGNNGTGKSRLLGSIARVLIGNFRSKPNDLFYFSNFEKTSKTNKVISVSNSLSDKFPLDKSFKFGNEINFKEEPYNYLGTRGRMGSSSHILIKRAIDILLENYSNKYISKCYRHVFDYLDYKPVIILDYKIIQRELSILADQQITPLDLERYINKKSIYSGLNQSIYSKLSEKYRLRFAEICDFLNNLKFSGEKNYELEIDFSSTNINKLERDNTKYEIDLKTYEILSILRKINMVRSFDVKLFKKKGNRPFSFSDASSGEANILCTLIALIPLVEDNSCILIDEPEISLHPTWQYRYIELLNKIFENFKGCHIIIASHSHFLVSDLPSNNSSVVTLKKVNGGITSQLLNESTFGLSAEDILLNVFEMPTTRNYYISSIVTEALELIAKKQKKKARFNELKEELENIEPNLKDEDPLKLVINSIFKL
jgi:predicted ATPase